MNGRQAQLPNLEVTHFSAGAGLRPIHYPDLLNYQSPSISWFEVITENFLATQGRPHRILEQLRNSYPVAFHGVNLSIGSTDDIDVSYLNLLKNLIQKYEPFIVSDHFCWTGAHGITTHNLLPLPLNKKSLESMIPRIQFVQEFLQRSLIFENASAYMQRTDDEIPEWEFISEVCRRTGCGILLDINNIYVTGMNFGLDPKALLSQVPVQSVKQIHLAGHTDLGKYLFDTHSTAIPKPVWHLFDQWLSYNKGVPTMIEWDENIPPLPILEAEVEKIKQRASSHNFKSPIESHHEQLT